jgi:hypothetical protein
MSKLMGVVRLLKKEQDRLATELRGIGAALAAFGHTYGKRTGGGKISKAGRARIAAAQRARWAKAKAKSDKGKVVSVPKKRTMSASARKKIAAAQRARWATAKAAKKTA